LKKNIMKKHATITIATLWFTAFLASIAGSPAAAAQDNASIQAIRQHTATINRSAAKYRKVKKDLSGFSAEGGQMIAYFDGPNVTKIAARFYGESGRASEEYYYWDGRLIFVLRTDYGYSKPSSGKVMRTEVSRFYFNDDKLIRWIDEGGKQVAPLTSEFAAKQKDYLDSSRQFTEGARSSRTTITAALLPISARDMDDAERKYYERQR
jgi:hypothetical protein